MSEILFYNASFHTAVTEDESYAYMLTKEGRITGLFAERPVCPGAESVDLGGAHVYPGLIDAHMHLTSSVLSAEGGCDLCELTPEGLEPHNLAGAFERIAAFSKSRPNNRVLSVNNYIVAAIDENRLPTRTELDECSGNRAVMVQTIDGHASASSSEMLKLLGLSPTGSGQLFGLEHESVQGRFLQLCLEDMDEAALLEGAKRLESKLAGYGIVHIGALEGCGSDPDESFLRRSLALSEQLVQGVTLYPQYWDEKRVECIEEYAKTKRIGGCGDWEMDGAVGAHTAAFYEGYGDNGAVAPCYLPQEEVDEKVERLSREGWAIASHAIGTAAIDCISRAMEKAQGGRMQRIEHFEFPSTEAVNRAIALRERVAITMQPGFSWIDKRYQRSYVKYLTPGQIARQRLATLVRNGVIVCGSSDSPVQSCDPFLQMQGMTEFYVESESISPYEAFRCYSINPARALELERELGTLELGKRADFFTADSDFFTTSPGRIGAFRVRETYIGGRKI